MVSRAYRLQLAWGVDKPVDKPEHRYISVGQNFYINHKEGQVHER